MAEQKRNPGNPSSLNKNRNLTCSLFAVCAYGVAMCLRVLVSSLIAVKLVVSAVFVAVHDWILKLQISHINSVGIIKHPVCKPVLCCVQNMTVHTEQ